MTSRVRRVRRTLASESRSTAPSSVSTSPLGGSPTASSALPNACRAWSRQSESRYWNSGDSALSSPSALRTRRPVTKSAYNPADAVRHLGGRPRLQRGGATRLDARADGGLSLAAESFLRGIGGGRRQPRPDGAGGGGFRGPRRAGDPA